MHGLVRVRSCLCVFAYVKEAGTEAKTRGGNKKKKTQMKLASQQLQREEAVREMAESGCAWVEKKHLWETGPFDEELISSLKPLKQAMLL